MARSVSLHNLEKQFVMPEWVKFGKMENEVLERMETARGKEFGPEATNQVIRVFW